MRSREGVRQPHLIFIWGDRQSQLLNRAPNRALSGQKSMGDGEDISKNSVIRSEIGLSLHKTRELVTSWVGKSQDKLCFEGEKEGIDSEDDAVFSGRARKRQVCRGFLGLE